MWMWPQSWSPMPTPMLTLSHSRAADLCRADSEAAEIFHDSPRVTPFSANNFVMRFESIYIKSNRFDDFSIAKIVPENAL